VTLLPRIAMVAGAFAVLQAGCVARIMRPNITAVTLSLATSPAAGSPSQPIAAEVRVRNVGDTRVWHCGGCGCDVISLRVLGSDGREVWLRDPKAVGPACPPGFEPLDPGREVTGRLVFTGTLFMAGQDTWPTPTYPAPAGTYTVVAGFSYEISAPGPPEEWIPLERRATFTWKPRGAPAGRICEPQQARHRTRGA